jgi:hypothetical protein
MRSGFLENGDYFTYSVDYLSSGLEPPPVALTVFDFGRRTSGINDDRRVLSEVVGLPVEMTFRNIFE